jgi:hypothetical protein
MARFSLLLLSACAVPVTAAPVLTCTTRRSDYVESNSKSDLQLIECMSSEDLHVTGPGGTGPFPASSSAAELTAATVDDNLNFAKTVACQEGVNHFQVFP